MAIAVMVPVVMGVVMPMVMRPWAIGADAPDMVMVTDLRRALVAFVADDLFAVLAQLAVHVVVAGERLVDPLDEGVYQ